MITDEKKRELAKEWDRLTREMERAQNSDQARLAASYENSIARIERQMGDADPMDWLE